MAVPDSVPVVCCINAIIPQREDIMKTAKRLQPIRYFPSSLFSSLNTNWNNPQKKATTVSPIII